MTPFLADGPDPDLADKDRLPRRFYDARIDAWRSTWIGPAKGLVLPRRTRRRRRAVESKDDGASWSLVQEMAARRP